MARGAQRAPSQNAYRGSIGKTRTESIHITTSRGDLVAATIHTAIDAVTDPELVERLHAGELNVVRVAGADGEEAIRVGSPVVYHDPAAEVMVLVLGDAQRHRELAERIALLEKLAADGAPVPAYAKEFGVVFGSAGLRAYLEKRAQDALQNVDKERRHAELDRAKQQLERDRAENARLRAELDKDRAELERARADMRARVIASVSAEETTIGPPPTAPVSSEDLVTKPLSKTDVDDIATDLRTKLPPAQAPNGKAAAVPAPVRAIDPSKVEYDEEDTTGAGTVLPPGSDPLTTETNELPHDKIDAWLETAAKASTSTFHVAGDRVRLALVAGDPIARGLEGVVDARLLLHRLATCPVAVLVIGSPVALRVPNPTQLAVIPLDVGAQADRAVLAALAKKFELVIDIVARGKPVRRVRITAPLAENAAYILRAADDHLRGLTADGEAEPSFARARDLVLGAGYDLLGHEHPEQAEFRDDKLAQIETASQVRRAIAIARRFARPSREDYLVCARGYPLSRWRELRRQVLERAVAWGLWMGPELAQVAVSEGFARSRRDLVTKLDEGFEHLRRLPGAFDLDSDASDDNYKSLAEEARALGVELRRKGTNGTIRSEEVSVVSGSIERTPTEDVAPKPRSLEELVAALEDKKERLAAALELCDRGDARAAGPVINAAKKMSRAEAVRVLGKSVKLGAAATEPLVEGLGSSKAYLRHGCALALGLLRTEDGTHAVVELLVNEPTEIWREIARAVGQVGTTALMPLASHVGRLGEKLTPQVAERVAWAAAHIGVRGGKTALEQMAGGHSVMAPIAKQALALLASAAADEVRVRPGGETPRDVTVNRAFSRRFFESLEPGPAATAALHDLDASSPMETLEEADLIVEEEDELDESDLIHT
jgi:hypothetical protein